MIAIPLLLGAAPWAPPAGVPSCGAHTEAAARLARRPPAGPAAPPSDARALPQGWSIWRSGDIVVMRDMTGRAYGGRRGLDYEGMYSALEAFYAWAPDAYDFVTVLTNQDSSQTMGAWAFYAPMANDAEGIGEDVYSSGMALQGALFMNAWQYWDGGSDTLTSAVFGQELGHRWGSFVSYDVGDGRRDDILGRDDGHWSYWLASSNSPMEGNAWTDNGDGTFTLDPDDEVAYNDLDFYLMGLLPPEQVAPFFLIQEPDGLDRDASSSPEYYATGQAQTASGVRLDLTVDDIVRAEGERVPRAGDAQTAFSMAVVLVLAQGEQPDEEMLAAADRVRGRFAEVWEEDTLGLATLDATPGELALLPPDAAELAGVAVVPGAAR